MDTQFSHALTISLDVAPLTFIGSRNEKVNGKLVTFAGPHAWTTQEVSENVYHQRPFIVLSSSNFYTLQLNLKASSYCVCGARGKYYKSPVSVLRVTRQLTRLFECTNDVADRLAFLELSMTKKVK
ncbi:hypothetical protein TB1_003639 [Malus domestica]